MFSVGQYVYDIAAKERVQIIEVSVVWGYVSYKLYNPASGLVSKLPAEAISAELPKDILNESFLRYITLLCKIKNETSTGVLSKLSDGVIPLPHQLYALNRALSNNNIRYILADEVGLGKTIEAGMIIKELKTRGLVKRVLVVCPKGLVTQWDMEMQEKFKEKFNVIYPEDYETIKKITGSNDVFGQFNQVISPIDSIKPLERRAGWDDVRIERYNNERIHSIINSGWDLIVIDEAHKVSGSSGEIARHKLGSLLAKSSPYLLLLTATPHNGKTEPFLRLIRLLDEKAFPNYKAIVKEQVAPYVIRTEKRDAIDNKGEKLFKERQTKIVAISWDERHSLQRKLYQMVTDYVSRSYNKAMRNRGKNMWFVFLLIMMQRLVTSSTRAIRQSMEKRLEVLQRQEFSIKNIYDEAIADMNPEETLEDAVSSAAFDTKEEITQIDSIISLAKQAEYQYSDVKAEHLLALTDDLFTTHESQKAIIFTEFVATQEYLKELLNAHGYTVSTLNGSMSVDERNAVLADFRSNTDLLISTDAGGEGLNLQFSNCVINFDLPWNPMKVEQRIGRVDRIGQTCDVMVYNFVLSDTVENRIRVVLEEKLSVILKELGVDKYADVLDSEVAGIDFTDVYMNTISNARTIERNIRPIEENLKSQVQNVMLYRDLMHEDKDLHFFAKQEAIFDFEKRLGQMVTYYENSRDNPYMPVVRFGINDASIVRHLNKELLYDPSQPVLKVTINDFPNEKGYFLLWQLCVSADPKGQKIIAVFVNDDLILRPMAGIKIWEAMLDSNRIISVQTAEAIDEDLWNLLKDVSQEFAYNTFLALKSDMEKKNEETYQKYQFALNLRIEAARRIGIDNIRRHKLARLTAEKNETEKQFEESKRICPDFKPILLVRME